MTDTTLDQPDAAAPVAPQVRDHLLSNKMYDALKLLAQILFPAAGALYFAMSGIWGLPGAEKVIGSITAVDVFLGVILSLSTVSYNGSEAKYDGAINVAENATTKTLALDFKNPEGVDSKKQIVLKVNS